ncbi:MAG TPA: hypothetical protein VE826_06025 [Dongiaceae bacterium]|nr:hypothetical protein [Dongiaceae bacterium]
MKRTLAAVVALAALVIAAPRSSGAFVSQPAWHGGVAQISVPRRPILLGGISYKLGRVGYPKGYRPRCGKSLNAFAIEGATVTSVFSFPGGVPITIYVAPCHAAPGDSMTATLTNVYGHVVFASHPSPGNFSIKDGGADAQATLVIKDNTTGASVTKSVWYAY